MPRVVAAGWLWLCLAVVIGPAAVVVAGAKEAWPWTCAPMFAAPVDDLALYVPRIVVVDARGRESRFAAGLAQLSQRHYLRLLFVRAYGSVEPSSPHGWVEDDTPERFRARLDAFFDATMTRAPPASKKHELPPAARTLRLELTRVDAHAKAPKRVVGSYDLATKTFTLAAASP